MDIKRVSKCGSAVESKKENIKIMETYEEKRKKALDKADRIIAYRNEVEEKALRTDRTTTKFWGKSTSVNIRLQTMGIAFGNDSITLHDESSVQGAITRLLELIVELEIAVEELETVKNMEKPTIERL